MPENEGATGVEDQESTLATDAPEGSEQNNAEPVAGSEDDSSLATDGAETPEGGKPEGEEGGKSEPEENFDSVKVPEGSLLKEGAREAVITFAKEHGLSAEKAQALLERDNATVADSKKSQQERLAKQREMWKAEAKNDKEFGGDNFAKNVRNGQATIDKYANDNLKGILRKTGLGNQIDFLKFISSIGADHLVEDNFDAVGEPKTTVQIKPIEEVLYDHPTSK